MSLYKRIIVLLLFIIGLWTPGAIANAYQYPIPELGNCRDRQECFLYCEAPNHKAVCWSYKVYSKLNVLGDESPEDKIASLGISFPVPELGNCANLRECKTYCDRPLNTTACKTWAQSIGLSQGNMILRKAAEVLGCQTKEECRVFCQQETNQTACREFAERFHLKGSAKKRILESAQEELGCKTLEECRTLCAESENQEKCALINQKINPGQDRKEELVERAKLELGCTSFEDCRSFCQNPENEDRCKNFGSAVSQGVRSKLQSELDCTTNEECKRACETNPEKCPSFPKMNPRSSQTPQNQREKNKKNEVLPTEENKRLMLQKTDPRLKPTPQPSAL